MNSLLDYLKSLPAATPARLWTDTRTAIAIFRNLPIVAQYSIQRLMLISDATPFEELRSWHSSEFKAIQNPALLLLKQLQILQGRSGEVWLNEEFRMSLVRAFSGDLEISNGDDKLDDEGYGEAHWDTLLYKLVSGGLERRKGHLNEVLHSAGLIDTRNSAITSVGFQFLLAERSAQLWTLVIQYFLMLEASGLDVVPCIIAICRMSLVSVGSLVTEILPTIMVEFLCDLGLVRSLHTSESAIGRNQDRSEFYATSLTSHLILPGGTSMRSLESGYIVVETNYKVYAYTSSPLQIAILGLFVRLKDRFSNMIQGQITGPSVQNALSKGITASQIITYLKLHLHPVMLKAGYGLSPVVEDQIHLWERDRNRLCWMEGYCYEEFIGDEAFRKTVGEAQRLAAALYVNYQKRILVVKEEAHPSIKAFIKSELH